MDNDKAMEPFTQVFSRFFITGLVFYLFVIWLPLYAYLDIDTNKLMSGPFFVVLFSIMLGLLLDLSKSYRPFWPLAFSSPARLRRVIVKAFNIHTDDSIKSERYHARMAAVSREIHDNFIRINHPDLDKKILDARIYPNILGVTLLSITLFFLIGVVVLILLLIAKLWHPLGCVESLAKMSYTPLRITIQLLLNLVALYVLIKGQVTAKSAYDKTTALTSSVIAKGYAISDETQRDRFLRSMEGELVTYVEENGRWQIREGD